MLKKTKPARRLFFPPAAAPLPQCIPPLTLTTKLSLFHTHTTELVGTRGIEPLRTIIEQRRVPGDLLESFSGTPTLIWLLDSLGVEAGAAADLFCLLGALLAGAASVGILGGCTPLFVALSLLYLAVISPLASATARGSSLPWAELSSDALLLESAFAAALWAPLWPTSKEEEDEQEEVEGGARGDGSDGNKEAASSSSLSAPALAPAFLLRWIVAKNAFLRGLCRWKRINGSAAAAAAVLSSSSSISRTGSLVALVSDVALAPLALSPARFPRLVAAAALLVSWTVDVAAASQFSFSSSSSKSTPPLWTLLLRPVLVLPLFHAGLLDSGNNGNDGKKKSGAGTGGSSSNAKLVTRFLVSAAAAVPALFSALGVLNSSPSSSSFESSLSTYAPYCLAAAGMTMLASLSADVLQSMSSASIGLVEEEEEEKENKEEEKKEKPMTLSMRRRQEQEQQKQNQQKVQYVRGAHEPALVGAISLMLFCAGCLEVSSAVASPAARAADRGCSGGPGCGGGSAALVVGRRLSWLARPWRATGPSFGSMQREEEGFGGVAASDVAIEVRRSDCRDGDDDDDESASLGWERVSPRSRSSRVAAALSSLSPRGGEGEDGEHSSALSPPPWLDHLLYRLVSDPGGPVAASFVAGGQQQQQPSLPAPPCAARAVVVGSKGSSWASFSLAEASDASSPAAERLARHGWGPLVEYERPSRLGRAVADAVALPRKVLGFGDRGESGGGGFSVVIAGAGAACSIAVSAATLAVVRRGRGGSPEATASSKKRD